MSSLVVDKIKCKVTLYMADQSQTTGYFFLSPYSESGVGAQTVYEILTLKDRFIPFENTQGEFCFLNKSQIIWVTKLFDEGGPDADVPTKVRRISVFLRDGKIFRGDVVKAMPEGKNRLSDLLNEFSVFLEMKEDRREILINMDYVIRVA